ncbi:MAG: hypothetical protein D6693_00840 [Planctomycetota bacterium]|nr:MAG: hypothetical protein D6693_00840 [Planctomycetota bacterium]
MTYEARGAVRTPWRENRLGLDYRREAQRLGPPPAPIIDAHSHIHGLDAARVYLDAREAFGVSTTYTMSSLDEAEGLRDLCGESIRFIAVPEFMAQDRLHAQTAGFLDAIERFHALGSRIVKFWTAPRGRDYGAEVGDPALMSLDHPWRVRAMERAHQLGMMFMVHVADPDTWFRTKYADATVYGDKPSQYEPLERAIARYPDTPWLLAHLGGWPENLDFLDALLDRHERVHLDTSATKWIVRELSAHPTGRVRAFFDRWRGRLLFGSDIVTLDAHLAPAEDPALIKAQQASNPDEAFELYASRYWALRTLFETGYDGESPIADSDLALVDPDRYTEDDAPRLRGLGLPRETLADLYRNAAAGLLEAWAREHP